MELYLNKSLAFFVFDIPDSTMHAITFFTKANKLLFFIYFIDVININTN